MSAFDPPTPEEIAALTPGRVRAAIEELEAKATMYPKETEHAIRMTIAGMKKFVEIHERLTHPDASIDDLLAILGGGEP